MSTERNTLTQQHTKKEYIMEQQNSKELRHKLHIAVSQMNATTDEIVRLATEIKETLQEAHTL